MSEKTHSSLLSSCNNTGHGTTDLCGKFAELSVAPCKQAHNEQLKRSELSSEAREEIQDGEKTFTVEEIVQGLKSNDLAVITACARASRNMLCKVQNPVTIDVMVSAGVIKPLVDALERDDCPDLQFEAAWAIVKIASGTNEHAMSVVDGGAIPKLVALLARGGEVGEPCARALGNIAEHGPQTRDTVLSHGALPALLPLCTASTPVSQLRATVWTYSQFCSHENPLVKLDDVAPGLPYISDLLEIADEEVLVDACCALADLTLGPNERIEAVQMTPRLLPRINALLAHKSPEVHTAALVAIANMLAGSYEQKERCLDVGCLNHIIDLLHCGKPSLMQYAAMAVRNILAGTAPQIQRTIDGGVLAHLLHVLATEDINPDLQYEAACAIRNITCETHEHIMSVVDGGAIPKLVALLVRGGEVGESCAWALGNIAEDGPQTRDTVLSHGALPALLPLCTASTPVRQLRAAVWTYRQFCSHENPRVKLDDVAPGLPYISDLLEIADEEVLEEACWALTYLTEGPNEYIEAVQMTPRLLPRINALLAHKSPEVHTAALVAIGNMLARSDEQTDRCLDVGCLNHIIDLLRCGKPSIMEQAAMAVSNILAGTAPQIQRAIDGGVLAHLLHVLATEDINPDLQYEAACAITNIASGTHEHTMSLVDGGAIPKLVALLARGGEVGEPCARALGYIAEHGPQTRDTVLSHGALPALLPLCTASTPVSQLRAAVWTYRQFCSHENPRVKLDYVAPGLPYISDLLEIADEEVLEQACCALSCLIRGPDERKDAVVAMTPRVLPRINALLAHKSPAVRGSALGVIINMLCGSYERKDRCLDVGCLHHIIDLLRCGEPSLMQLAAMAVGNILTGTAPQIQRAIDGGVLAHLLHVLATEDIKCQKEAAEAITNLCLGGTPEQLDALISAGFLEPYCQLLHAPDHEAITEVLDGLTNLLKTVHCHRYDQQDALALQLEEIGALEQIEKLQEHENEQISKKAMFILDKYFTEP